jgi:hypothetical protein
MNVAAAAASKAEVGEVGFRSRGLPYRPIAVGACSRLLQATEERGRGRQLIPLFPPRGRADEICSFTCRRDHLCSGGLTQSWHSAAPYWPLYRRAAESVTMEVPHRAGETSLPSSSERTSAATVDQLGSIGLAI